MANYYATWRSNYFKVKDLDLFEKELEPLGVEVREKGYITCSCELVTGPRKNTAKSRGPAWKRSALRSRIWSSLWMVHYEC